MYPEIIQKEYIFLYMEDLLVLVEHPLRGHFFGSKEDFFEA